jgi:hypothetical protein
MAVGWLGVWLSCNMHTWQWDVWASGSAVACTRGTMRFGQVAQLQHAHMPVGWLGKWRSYNMHTWQLGGWAGGIGAACTRGIGMVG